LSEKTTTFLGNFLSAVANHPLVDWSLKIAITKLLGHWLDKDCSDGFKKRIPFYQMPNKLNIFNIFNLLYRQQTDLLTTKPFRLPPIKVKINGSYHQFFNHLTHRTTHRYFIF